MDEVKRVMTENFSKDAVIGREVYSRVYQSLTEKEKREEYEKNKQYFSEPGEVTLSRIFIALGKDPVATQQRAAEIAVQAKSGTADFAALAKRYSEEPLGKDGGKIGSSIKIPDLAPEVKAAVETGASGSVTDPVKLENGFYIFRIDERKETKVLPFEDEKVQDAIGRFLVGQRAEKQVEAYLATLRDDAFIEIDQRYQFENSKVKSAQIKRIPYSEESAKEKKKRKKEEEKKAEREKKPAAGSN
ncbi:MAG: peptidyl-prolyl cis-trans isomerase [Acidobacteria bacterium]|nr:peptidyl-prolyl cis-trans isomerase [Acidobacteriota bacterium]